MWQGVQLMVVGMTTVIAFLTFMVGLMQVSARVFAGYASTTGTNDLEANPIEEPDDLTDIAVAFAAIEAWRQQEGG